MGFRGFHGTAELWGLGVRGSTAELWGLGVRGSTAELWGLEVPHAESARSATWSQGLL